MEHATGATVVDGYAITRDVRGNPTEVTTTTPAGTSLALYAYDAVSRLRSECYPLAGVVCTSTSPRSSYTYDKVGNRTSESARTVVGSKATTVKTVYAYDAADQLLTQSVGGVATTTNTWGLNGALGSSTTAAGTKMFTTDLTDELVSVTLEDDSTVGYTHDAQGNRTSRLVDGVTDVSWAWDELSSLPVRTGEYNTAGALATAWLPDPTSSTGSPLADSSGGVASWMLSDPFANTVASVSMTGTVRGAKSLNAFGVVRATATGTMADSPVGFAGKYLDDATGLYDMRARDYDPASGRFSATDPVQVPTGMPYVAGYSYSFNNPLMFTDATGMNPFSDVVSGAASAAWDFTLNDIALTQPGLGGNTGWAAQRRYDMYRGFRLGVQENGYWTQINESANPVLQTLQAGDATITSFQEGDYHGAGGHLFDTELGAANTCLIAYGGAKLFGPKITAALPKSSAVTNASRTPHTHSTGVLQDPAALEGLTPSQIHDLALNAGYDVLPGKAGATNPATRYYVPGTNGSVGFRVLPNGVAGQGGIKAGPYLRFFGGPNNGLRVQLGAS